MTARDDVFEEQLKAVKQILESFDEDDLEEADADQLLEEGLDHLEQARELLSQGSGKTMVVDEEDGEIVEEPLASLDE